MLSCVMNVQDTSVRSGGVGEVRRSFRNMAEIRWGRIGSIFPIGIEHFKFFPDGVSFVELEYLVDVLFFFPTISWAGSGCPQSSFLLDISSWDIFGNKYLFP